MSGSPFHIQQNRDGKNRPVVGDVHAAVVLLRRAADVFKALSVVAVGGGGFTAF